jgi:beta-mannosidase
LRLLILGRHFYFEVNGEPIFMKGSNWIPAHVLPEIGSQREYAENLLHASAEAGFNMLRVWGGGVYESEHFYEVRLQISIAYATGLTLTLCALPTVVRRAGHPSLAGFVVRVQHVPS